MPVKLSNDDETNPMIATALRVPLDLHRAIHANAKRELRTFNSEIVYQLKQRYGLDAGAQSHAS